MSIPRNGLYHRGLVKSYRKFEIGTRLCLLYFSDENLIYKNIVKLQCVKDGKSIQGLTRLLKPATVITGFDLKREKIQKLSL